MFRFFIVCSPKSAQHFLIGLVIEIYREASTHCELSQGVQSKRIHKAKSIQTRFDQFQILPPMLFESQKKIQEVP